MDLDRLLPTLPLCQETEAIPESDEYTSEEWPEEFMHLGNALILYNQCLIERMLLEEGKEVKGSTHICSTIAVSGHQAQDQTYCCMRVRSYGGIQRPQPSWFYQLFFAHRLLIAEDTMENIHQTPRLAAVREELDTTLAKYLELMDGEVDLLPDNSNTMPTGPSTPNVTSWPLLATPAGTTEGLCQPGTFASEG